MTSQKDSDLEVMLGSLPADLQKRALRVLNEWGVSTSDEDSFPVRLALITRLQLWALAKTSAVLISERQVIADLVMNVSQALSSEAETREIFLQQFRSEERGEAQRIHSLARSIDAAQEDFLCSFKSVLGKLHGLTTLSPSNEPPSPSKTNDTLELINQAALKLDRSADQIVEIVADLASSRAAPTATPNTSRSTPPPLSHLNRYAAIFCIFCVVFFTIFLVCTGYFYLICPGQLIPSSLLLACLIPSVPITFVFLLCIVIFPR